MFAHTSLGKETSTNAKAGLAPKPEVQPRSQEQESLEEFTPPTFSWNIGNIALSVPDDDGRTNPYNNGRAGWVPRRHAQLPWPMQAKLEVGSVDDPLEHEADRVAEQVMRMPDPAAQGSPTLSHEAGERNSGYTTLSGSSSAVQRKCSSGSCDKCKSEQADEEQHTVRRLPAAPQILAAASSPSAGKAAPPIVREVLRSPGRPLDRESRNYFEPRFQFDFSRVRIWPRSNACSAKKATAS